MIGWAGDKGKKSKNYHSLVEPIKQYFDRHPGIQFVETSGAYAYEDMPRFYRSIDLLLITSSSEGGGAPALEALPAARRSCLRTSDTLWKPPALIYILSF